MNSSQTASEGILMVRRRGVKIREDTVKNKAPGYKYAYNDHTPLPTIERSFKICRRAHSSILLFSIQRPAKICIKRVSAPEKGTSTTTRLFFLGRENIVAFSVSLGKTYKCLGYSLLHMFGMDWSMVSVVFNLFVNFMTMGLSDWLYWNFLRKLYSSNP